MAVATAALIAASLPFAVRAQEQPEPEEDGPGRGVARISLINGDVSVRRGDTGENVAAAMNSPVVVEDRVLTGVNSRAEVQFDASNYLRLSNEAEIRLSELENGRYQIQLARGLISFNVLRDNEADVEIATPVVSIRPSKKGSFSVVVRPDGTTEITVRQGEVEIFTPQGSERLKSGRSMVARGTQGNPEVQVVAASGRDEWDDWNDRRNKDLDRAQASTYQYVDRDVYGAEDLDGQGDWVDSAPYGRVWAPRVADDWAPYRNGRWSWVDWYGWTWVSYDSWGWAPYHYGRWFQNNNRWCWWPGGMGGHHYWRPGLVAFVGWGGGGIGVGFGHVGWIPLAPYERYHPWYGNRYYNGYRNGGHNNVNIVNNFNINNSYRNSRVRNGITGMNGSDFGSGRGRHEGFNSRDIGQASLVRGQVPFAPTRDSARFSNRESRVTRASNENERFYSRRTPAAVNRVSFDDQRRGMEQVSRRTFGESATGGTRGTEATGGGRQSDGFVRGGESGNRSSGADTGGRGASADNTNSGWRRFGDSSGRSSQAQRGAGGNEVRGASDNGGRGATAPQGSADNFSQRNESNSSGQSNGWRRLGSSEGRSTDSRQTDGRSYGGRSSDDRSSRGSDIGSRSAEPSGRSSTSDSNANGWRRFGDPGSSPSQRGSSGDRGSQIDRSSQGSSNQGSYSRGSDSQGSSGRSADTYGGRSVDRGSSRNESRSASPRISAPIVRERSNENYTSRSGGDFGGRSSGRSEQRAEPRSSPRSSGGGFGGRSSGASPSFSGGGGRSSGGNSSGSFSGGRSSGGNSGRSSSGGGGGRSSGGGHGGRGK
ncbi:MAG: DUF6600 domain-containing protein [Acidobacteriota bacterium]